MTTATKITYTSLAVGEVSGLDQAVAETNRVEYGLTAGIFSGDQGEVERFFDEVGAACAT